MPSNSFTLKARLFHYVGLTVIIALLIVGFLLDYMSGPVKLWSISLHKLIGFAMLFVGIGWWISYLSGKSPAYPNDLEKWKVYAARIVKVLLLACAVIMPLSGWLMSVTGGRPQIPALGFALPAPFAKDENLSGVLWQIHESTAFILAGLIAAHAGAALYHHFIRRDFVLSRMFPFVSQRSR